jgi:phage replisome organizer, putative, N-terminal region
MKERRYVKFKVDIYDDTKTKIIDQKPERDFIHYFFARCIVLAGKSNCEGKLYMAKDIPYTIETLGIEFNRDAALVKIALDVLIELKMIEVTEDNIYKVKSFGKHQNIKVEEKVKSEVKEVSIKNIEAAAANTATTNEACDKKEKKSEKQEEKDKEFENNVDKNAANTIINEDKIELEINASGIKKEYNINGEISDNINQNSITIPFQTKKNKKVTTKKKKEYVINVSDEEDREDEESVSFKEGEYVLGEGERLISAWTF